MEREMRSERERLRKTEREREEIDGGKGSWLRE